MVKLFTELNHALGSAPGIALGASFIWGTLSVLLSPCHLTSIPLIIGFLSNQKELSAGKAFRLSFLFSIGILLSIALVGGITASAGRILGDVGAAGNLIVAGIFLVFGLYLLGLLPLNRIGFSPPKTCRGGIIPIFLLGLAFGLALGPCTFAFMAPVLGVVFSLTSTNTGYGVLLLSAFAIGHCVVIITAGSSTHWVQKIAKWNETTKWISMIRKVCGSLILLGGIYLVYSTL